MLIDREWLKREGPRHAFSALFGIATFCCIILVIAAFTGSSARSGIGTLTFNFPSVANSTGLRKRLDIQSVESAVESTAANVATAATSAAGQAKSVAISAEASAASEISAIESVIPHKFTFGTKQFCVGDQPCQNLPVDVSTIMTVITSEAVKAVDSADLQSLSGALTDVADVAKANVMIVVAIVETMAIGLLAAFSLAAIRIDFLSRFLPENTFFKSSVCLVVGIICCIPSIAVGRILDGLQSKSKQLPGWMGLKVGKVKGLSVGYLALAVFMAILCTAIPWLFHRSQREDTFHRSRKGRRGASSGISFRDRNPNELKTLEESSETQ